MTDPFTITVLTLLASAIAHLYRKVSACERRHHDCDRLVAVMRREIEYLKGRRRTDADG